MNRDYLIESARKLPAVPAEAVEEYAKKVNMLTELLNEKMNERKDLIQLIGENNHQMMLDNHHNHALFMQSVFSFFNEEVLVDTVIWVFSAYRNHGFSRTYWSAQLEAWLQIYKENLSETAYNAIYPYYNWMIINIPVFSKVSETQ